MDVRKLKTGFYFIHIIHKDGIIRKKIIEKLTTDNKPCGNANPPYVFLGAVIDLCFIQSFLISNI